MGMQYENGWRMMKSNKTMQPAWRS